MPAGSSTGPSVGAGPQYRFRGASGTSGWMSAEQLRELARQGSLDPRDEVQASGRAEWIVASQVKGLDFPRAAEPEQASPPGSATGHHVKFGTLKEVLGTFLHAEVEMRGASGSRAMRLVAVGTDHFEATEEGSRRRVFVPYLRLRSLVAEELAGASALNYREAHRLAIVVDGEA